MPNWRRQFKILTHVPLLGRYESIPEFVIVSWCKKRKRFRIKERLAVGIAFRRPDEFGKQLAEQHNLPWVKTFDPQWKLHDLMLMRLKGKI